MPLAGDGWQWRIYIVKFWMRAPPGVQILSILCSFWENLAKSYVGAPLESWRPLLGQILDPPLDGVLIQWQIKDFPEGRRPKLVC